MSLLRHMLVIVLSAMALPAYGFPVVSVQIHGAAGLPGLLTAHDVIQVEKEHPCHITGDSRAQSGSDYTNITPRAFFYIVIGVFSSSAMPLGAKGIHILVPVREPVYISAAPIPLERPLRIHSTQLYGLRLFAVRHPYSSVSEYVT